MNRFDVVIIGAGLTGCATAAALAQADPQRQRKILLLDKCKGVHPQFSGELIHPRGAQILDDLGFYAPLSAAGGVDVDGFVVFENADARHIELDYASVPGERPRGVSVHHKTLVRTLRRELQLRGGVELREGWSLLDLCRDERGGIAGVVVQDPGKQPYTIECDLLVAADGKGSTVRKLAGIGDEGRQILGFTAGVEVENAALPRPTYAQVLLGAWGPVLAYPIERAADGTLTSRITFDLPKDLPAKGLRLKEYLLRAYVPFIPAPLSAQVATAVLGHRGCLEMAPTVNLPAPTAAMPGLALVGDAAGCSHPITASGMTMGLRDAETLGQEGRRRMNVPAGQPWIDFASLRRYRAEHDRYVPTRQALADAIYEAFRGGQEGPRAIRRALFEYWGSSNVARQRSMSLLSCSEGRASVFLTEYLKTARHALEASFVPQHASHFPMGDRVRKARGAARLAKDKLGLVAQVMWAQVRPSWLPRTYSML
jgi:2-polyprenyl-6-methoxyphenol hydroxylase-like FAD-dependent oxidoreductase